MVTVESLQGISTTHVVWGMGVVADPNSQQRYERNHYHFCPTCEAVVIAAHKTKRGYAKPFQNDVESIYEKCSDSSVTLLELSRERRRESKPEHSYLSYSVQCVSIGANYLLRKHLFGSEKEKWDATMKC
eukprot:scaffold4383_cov61-Cyclotella_meneghiniana.AAC.2